MISRLDDQRLKIFNALQGKIGSQQLNVVPWKNLGLKLDDQQLRISIGLRLEANSVMRIRATEVKVEQDGLHGLSYTTSAGRFSRHATLISLIKQTLGHLALPSVLEPRGLYRTDFKRPDGVTMIAWEMCKQLVWDVTVVDALAHSRLNQGSLCNPGTRYLDSGPGFRVPVGFLGYSRIFALSDRVRVSWNFLVRVSGFRSCWFGFGY